MPEIRKNLITGEYVILAPARAQRPHEHQPPPPPAPRPPLRADCPFCPGNEASTPGCSLSLPEGPQWRVRAFPNKYSALSVTGEAWSRKGPLHEAAAGIGPHEVICETRRHDRTLSKMDGAEVAEVVRAWHQRFRAFSADPRIAHVSLFKNHGPRAGTSLEHAHSQIVGLPMIPERQQRRGDAAEAWWRANGRCLFCSMVEDELAAGERLVEVTPGFASFIPWAALSPFHLWIFPRRHGGCFAGAGEEELADLAAHLRAVLQRIDRALGDPDYNLVVQSAPPSQGAAPHRHWYVSVVPRVTNLAGFELGTAMYVNPAPPEESAARLRGA